MTDLRDKIAIALHDDDCSDRHCSGPALGAYYRQADIALNLAAPWIAAAERETIARLAEQHHAQYVMCDPPRSCGNPACGTRGGFADVIRQHTAATQP
jgi:hypothetical protein